MKNILITGCRGQIGWELQWTLCSQGQLFCFDKEDLNLASPDDIRKKIREVQPHIIVNAGAYTAVDKAEQEYEQALAINGRAPGILAEEAKKLKALLVHYSTDYVYDGASSIPYTEESSTNPLNAYGRSKLEGEKAIQSVNPSYLILRTSWVYGMRGKNFLLTMLRLAKEKDHLKIVDDQRGTPNWSRILAEATAQMVWTCSHLSQEYLSGIYHLSCKGEASWYEFALSIFHEYHRLHPEFRIPEVQGIPTSEYPTPAVRPKYSLLNTAKLSQRFGIALPDWRAAFQGCLA